MWGCPPELAARACRHCQGAEHRYARVNPHLHDKFHTVLFLELLRQPRHALRSPTPYGQPGGHCLHAREGIQVHHKPIAKMLGHPPIETLDDLVAHALYILNDLMDLFGIEWPGGYRRRSSTPQHR